MRILHVVPTYMPAWRYGGPIRSVHGLCKALAACGHDVHVYTTSVNGTDDLDVETGIPVNRDGVKVWYFPSHWLRKIYWSPPMRQALASQLAGFDVVHLHSVYLWPTWVAARIAERARRPYVVTPRGALVRDLIRRKSRWIKTAWIRLIERHTLEQASAIHVTSEREARELRKFGMRLPPTLVIPNAIEEVEPSGAATSLSPAVQAALQGGPYILYMGRISWEKGLDRLVPAMARTNNLKLVVAGNDESRYRRVVEELARQTHVTDRIIYLGHVDGADKQALLAHARLLVLPSYSENFGNAVLEAMQAGCPVVVTPEVGVAPIVERSGAGLVVPGEPLQFAEAIERIAHNDTLSQRLGEAGRRTVLEEFTWPVVAQRMEAAYRRILNDATHKPAGISGR